LNRSACESFLKFSGSIYSLKKGCFFQANFEPLWIIFWPIFNKWAQKKVNFWPIYPKKWPFLRQKNMEANFEQLLGQFLANLLKKKWPFFSRQKKGAQF